MNIWSVTQCGETVTHFYDSISRGCKLQNYDIDRPDMCCSSQKCPAVTYKLLNDLIVFSYCLGGERVCSPRK